MMHANIKVVANNIAKEWIMFSTEVVKKKHSLVLFDLGAIHCPVTRCDSKVIQLCF